MRGPGNRMGNAVPRAGADVGLTDVDALASPAPLCLARTGYRDRIHGVNAVKLMPGEYYATAQDMMIVTVLGSCVAACIRDLRAGVGGMNHFMLPDSDLEGVASKAARYGVYAMEVLVNHLLKIGARRENLEAKVFGGGNVLAGLIQANVGHRNAAFVLSYLRTEGIRVAARDLADERTRKVYYFPKTGRALVQYIGELPNSTLAERETEYRSRLENVRGSFESFDGR